jgi:hypothetical protein
MIDTTIFEGWLLVELVGEDGEVKFSGTFPNLITSAGDDMYARRGSGVSPPAIPTGMRIGTGSTAVAKTGAGAAIVTKVTAGNKAFDATFPSISGGAGSAVVVTYKTTYNAGEGTTASAITEAVIVNDTIATDVATAAANTIARAIISGVPSKSATDSLILTWAHNLLGA